MTVQRLRKYLEGTLKIEREFNNIEFYRGRLSMLNFVLSLIDLIDIDSE